METIVVVISGFRVEFFVKGVSYYFSLLFFFFVKKELSSVISNTTDVFA